MILTLLCFQRVLAGAGFSRVLWGVPMLGAAAMTVGVGIQAVRLYTLRYTLDDAVLSIVSAGHQVRIPYREIDDVVFRPRDLIDVYGYERYWPGYYDSLNQTSDGYWRTFATTPPHERVRIRTTGGGTVAISPERPVLFVEALEAFRGGAGRPAFVPPDANAPPTPAALPATPMVEVPPAPTAPAPQRFAPRRQIRFPRPLAYRLFRARIVDGDPVASRLLALSLLVLIVLVFMAAWKVDSVNTPLAVTWDANGEPTWFVRPDGVWIIDGVWIYPVAAGALIAVNCALATFAAALERPFEARLLLAAGFVTALMILAGMISTTGLI